jgi:flagellar hook-associated protein 1 FlgK
MSSFGSISVALSALQAHRRAMDVAGNNVANANTDGYTRQRAHLSPLPAPGAPSLFSTSRLTGSGVTVTSVDRLNDAFLDARVRTELGASGYLAARSDTLTGIEQLLNEPSDTGLSAQLDDFWAAWQDVANDPGEPAARSALLQQASLVATTLNETSAALTARAENTTARLEALAQQVSAVASSVADLNSSIRAAVAGGQPANELMDQRDVLVQQLSELTGADVRPQDDGTVDVLLGGTALVRGVTSHRISVAGQGTGDVHLSWAAGDRVGGVGGTVAGLLEGLNEHLPIALDQLDAVATALAGSVNAAHAAGQDLDGAPGGTFFTSTGARDIAVAISDARLVAAAAAGAGDLDGSNADHVVDAARGAADTAWRDMVVAVGVQVQSAARRSATQDDVLAQAQAAQTSASGVDLDEEMTNLVMFQRAYEGAARVMTAVDQALDTLINRTGLVGR